ncbi:MAG: hypothetical protein HUJ73_00380 [Eubacterium sp.]|nr:hypothetical protein [Eubacterium sp.]
MSYCGWKAEKAFGKWAVYSRAGEGWIVTQYPSLSGSQGMFYTLSNQETGKLIVIDGGWEADEEQVRRVIEEHGGVVDIWFLTHYHKDHIDAFNRIYPDPQGIEIRQVYVSDADPDTLRASFRDWDNPESYAAFLEVAAGQENITPLYTGDEPEIDDSLSVKVLNAYSEKLPERTKDLSNDLSLVLKFSGETDSILFCADARGKWVGKRMIKFFEEDLKSEYLQPGHHGNNGLPDAVYDLVSPSVALFDLPADILISDDYGAKELNIRFQAMDVTTYDYSTAPNGFLFK